MSLRKMMLSEMSSVNIRVREKEKEKKKHTWSL